eukprot:5622932-Amphidinium_carterae.1
MEMIMVMTAVMTTTMTRRRRNTTNTISTQAQKKKKQQKQQKQQRRKKKKAEIDIKKLRDEVEKLRRVTQKPARPRMGSLCHFLALGEDDLITQDMREGFIEFIGTSMEQFIEEIHKWLKIFDMSDDEYREYLAATSSAFPTAMAAGEVRSWTKEEILNLKAATSKKAAKPSRMPKLGDDDGDDDDQDNKRNSDAWSEWCSQRGMD